jgi:hypothetical protein
MTAAASRLDLDADQFEVVRAHLSLVLLLHRFYSTVTNQDWCPAQAMLRLDERDVFSGGGR